MNSNLNKKSTLKYHHLGFPASKPIPGEVYLKDYKVYHYGYEQSEFGIEWMRYEQDCFPTEFIQIARQKDN